MIIKSLTAILAKNRGFDIPTLDYYIKLRGVWCLQHEDAELGAYNWNEREGMSAPSQEQVWKWLYDKGCNVEVKYKNEMFDGYQDGFYYEIFEVLPDGRCAGRFGKPYVYRKNLFYRFDTYEEALEVGLQTGLTLIKPKSLEIKL